MLAPQIEPASPAGEKPPRPILAYTVREDEEGHSALVFATHRIAATRLGASQLDCDEIGGLSCKRTRWADQYAADGRVPASACVWAGWYFEECSGCGRRIDTDELAERRLTYRDVIGWSHGGTIYCCKTCKAQDEREDRRCKRAGAEYLDRVRAILLRRFPEAAVVREHVYVPRGQRPAVVEQAIIEFSWPGQKIGPASIRLDDSYRGRAQGPRRLTFTCCMGEREAFEAYAAATKGKGEEAHHG